MLRYIYLFKCKINGFSLKKKKKNAHKNKFESRITLSPF